GGGVISGTPHAVGTDGRDRLLPAGAMGLRPAVADLACFPTDRDARPFCPGRGGHPPRGAGRRSRGGHVVGATIRATGRCSTRRRRPERLSRGTDRTTRRGSRPRAARLDTRAVLARRLVAASPG